MKLEKTIFLIGFMGAGKTSVASRLSALTGIKPLEMDAEIVRREGMPITEIFAEKGEPYFRSCETNLLREFESREASIVSCGGGVPMREENVEVMKRAGKVVLLQARPAVILDRVKDSTDRPLLNGHMNEEYIAELMGKRREKYEAAADITVDTSDLTIEQVCQEILRTISETVEK